GQARRPGADRRRLSAAGAWQSEVGAGLSRGPPYGPHAGPASRRDRQHDRRVAEGTARRVALKPALRFLALARRLLRRLALGLGLGLAGDAANHRLGRAGAGLPGAADGAPCGLVRRLAGEEHAVADRLHQDAARAL